MWEYFYSDTSTTIVDKYTEIQAIWDESTDIHKFPQP